MHHHVMPNDGSEISKKTKKKAKTITDDDSPATAVAITAPRKRPKLKWRTRDTQNSQLYNLQLDIHDLRQEIQTLQQFREILEAKTLNRRDDFGGSYMKTVREYHNLFQHGYHPWELTEAVQSATTQQFVTQVMDEQIAIGRFSGREMMLDQWERYSEALSNLDLRYISSLILPATDYTTKNGDERQVVMVTSKASYESVFSLKTIGLIFPHLLKYKHVVDKLLGKDFRGIGHFDFVFDTNTHRVIGYDFRLDFFAAFARLLRDPTDLCLLFEGAKISEEFLIGDLDSYGHSDISKGSWHDHVVESFPSQAIEHQEAQHTQPWQLQLKNILDAPYEEEAKPTAPPAKTDRKEPFSTSWIEEVVEQDNQDKDDRPKANPWKLQMTNLLSPSDDIDGRSGRASTAPTGEMEVSRHKRPSPW